MTEDRISLERDAQAPVPLRDFTALRGLKDIPDPLLEAHLKLYEGYVENVNLLRRRLKEAELGSPEWSEMKRRMGFEENGLRLHELYFENLRPGASAVEGPLKEALAATWGSYGHWVDEFEAIGHMRGVGWAILTKDPVSGLMTNHWIGLHEVGHPVGSVPLLVMDLWEHAYSGMNRSGYIEAFFGNLHWGTVQARWTAA